MRLVVLPNIGISQALNDADFQGYCEMIQMANKFYDDMYWYFVVPQMMEGTVPELKRTQYVFVPERIDFRFHEYIASREFAKQFRRVGGEYFTDGMVTSRFGYGFIWEPLINNPYRLYDRYTVVLAETVAQTEEGNFYGYYPENALHALGCAMNPVLFLNGRTRAASRALAARYLSPNLLGEMDQRSHAYGFSVDADYVKLLNTKNKKYDRFTLFFGARFNYVKNVGLIYRIYDKFYSSGRDIDIVITTPNDELTVQQFDFTKQYLRNCIRLVYPRCDQFRYL